MKYRLLLIDWGLPSLLASSYMDFTIDNHDFSLGAPIELMQKKVDIAKQSPDILIYEVLH